ncbi:MAG: ATP-binding protein [Pyrinomonadaceae bacterium MAG19_C2-C3]|nr:ATP-binding protein [Pyrinomonadaceae bacterium MAG19_C2-C3]
MLTTRTWMLLIVAVLLLAAGVLNLTQRIQSKPQPSDGVEWRQAGARRVVAHTVAPASVAARAGIAAGDRLVAVSLTDAPGSYEQIADALDVLKYIEDAGAGGTLHYLIERPTNMEASRFNYADLYGLDALPSTLPRDVYLHLIGLVYLFVGFYVLFKQGGRAPYTRHFAGMCLAAFVFHFFKPLGSYEDLDAAIAILDSAAFVLFAPLFLHFCLIYPVRRHLFATISGKAFLSRQNLFTVGLYAPALILIALTTLAMLMPGGTPLDAWLTAEFVGSLYRAAFLHFVFALISGSGILIYRFFRSGNAVIRQQLKWVVWGSVLAVLPFTLLYAVGYLTGAAANMTTFAGANRLTDIAVLPLVLIPLTFGNSVVRYRLMDVDVVVRRAAVYALTTLTIAVMIGTVVYVAGLYALRGDGATALFVAPTFNSLRVIIAILAMAAIVMTAAPLKNFLQERTNRLFYGERYDLRNGLLDFGRTLSATTALDPLLDALIARLQQVLNVERIAIFIEDSRSPGRYITARTLRLSRELIVPPDFQEMIARRAGSDGIVRADDLELAPETKMNDAMPASFVRRALHYYVPCVVRGRMVAVIGLGRSAEGALLSSEDLEILRTVSGYVAVAIENSLLYQEQRTRAAELEQLKEFNESIIESINVGLVAVDLQGRITRCNSALEEMLGIERDAALNRSIEDLFAPDFADTLHNLLNKSGWQIDQPRSLYKIHTATCDNRPLVVNLGIAPLKKEAHDGTHEDDGQHEAMNKRLDAVASNALTSGALVVIEDVTERARLEEQLQQREKLSSIGLLAAGVAHEINTPLTGVSSYTQMLLGMLPETDPKHALLGKVQRQTDRAARIVGNLLNFSRTGVGVEFTATDINRVLDETMQLLEPQLRGANIEVKRDYATTLPTAFADASKLQQIFTNLVLNARDAIIESGTITLRTRADDDDERLIVEVTDTGSGITSENLNRIFDPFFTTKGVGRGTGLGLAVTYGIVQEHSGTIAVESTPETPSSAAHGTTFRITLPTAAARRSKLQIASD